MTSFITPFIRKLDPSDYYKGYLDLLSQLSPTTNNISQQEFYQQFSKLQDNTHIFIIEHNNKIVASSTLIIEYKFIHQLKNVGHIEDVIVDEQYRGKGLSQKLMDHMIEYCKDNECYKIILDCSEEYQKFYEKFGFNKKNIQMAMYF